MTSKKNREKAIPSTRLSRFGKIARMAGGVAAGMIGEGAKQLSQGNRPKVSDLLLTPSNAHKVANQLATMRGAAMKVGQLLSMETNDFLPQELADILAQLRNRAFIMPRAQLIDSMESAYGEDWESKFKHFDFEPLASASIGQVHRATTLGGKDIVLKIQYPGVAESIDSDVDNIATLFKVTNILPKHMDITDLLRDAKSQLHEEANYLQEAAYLETFREVLGEIALLDFGASRRFSKRFAIDYKRLLRAVANEDSPAIIVAADKLGYKAGQASHTYQDFLVAVFSIALEPFAKPGLYDFRSAQLSDRLSNLSQDGYSFKEFWQTPPTEILYLHRKLGGMFLLATRLGARVNTHELVRPYLEKLAL